MILKNLMEDKQLDFNQPLLSVRRGSLPAMPATSPEVNKRRTDDSHSNLPPLPYYKSDLRSGPIRNPGAVPFRWEQIPGRPKDENKEQKETLKPVPCAPKLPPGRVANLNLKGIDKAHQDSPASRSMSYAENNVSYSLGTSSVHKALSEHDESEHRKEDENISVSENVDVMYEDARVSQFPTESFFLNCSVSRVSSVDGLDKEPCEAFSDPQTQEFMMGRFLPAAKAVASETPLFPSRKPSVAREQPIHAKNVVTWNKPFARYYDIPNPLPHMIPRELEREEKNVEEDGCEDAEDLPVKLCGLLPRFCLLNPILGYRDHAQVYSTASSVRTRPVVAGKCCESDNKDRTENNKAGQERVTDKYDSMNGSSLSTHLSCNGIVPRNNESPLSLLGTEGGFIDPSKEHRDFGVGKHDEDRNGNREYKSFANKSTEETINSKSFADEKTLYIDSEQRVEARHSNSVSSDSRRTNPSSDNSLQDIQPLCDAHEKAISQPKIGDASYFSILRMSSHDIGEETAKRLQKDPNVFEANQKSGTRIALSTLLPNSPSESWLSRTLPSISSVDPRRVKVPKTYTEKHMHLQPPGELATILEC